jgi:hypothetical protein
MEWPVPGKLEPWVAIQFFAGKTSVVFSTTPFNPMCYLPKRRAHSKSSIVGF